MSIFASATSCVKDDDTQLPPFTSLVYLEDFEDVQDGTELNIPGFTNFAETGTILWTEEVFDGNGYTEFVANGINTEPAVTWLITPAIDLGIATRMLSFQSAQHHLAQEGNMLEVYIATDYNGTDVTSATWMPLKATFPSIYTDWYKFIYSGEIDLSGYSGQVHIAFKATMADASSGAAYFVDNIKVY
jgi:hypothetical protein